MEKTTFFILLCIGLVCVGIFMWVMDIDDFNEHE